MYRIFLFATVLASSGMAYAGGTTGQGAKLDAVPQWIEIEYADDNYASKFGSDWFSVLPPWIDVSAKGVQADALPDHGEQLREIRRAFGDGLHEGMAIKQGDISCQANGKSQLDYWVLFKDGMYIQGLPGGVVRLKHVPADWHWAPTFPLSDSSRYDLQNVRIAGQILGALYRQPCADAQYFFSMGKGRLYTVLHRSNSPLPSAPPPPPPPPPPSS